nr:hypothetical protein [Tanacetum cinerariifolium]
GTSSTNISITKDVASQDAKKDVSSLRYIALPNWFHEAHIETSNDTIRNSDAQIILKKNEIAMLMFLKAVGSPIPLLLQKFSQLIKWSMPFENTFGDTTNAVTLNEVEADLSNMETSIPMDVKSAFLYGTIDEEVYVMQPPRLQDPEFPERVYKALMHDKFQMSAMGELTFFLGLQVLQKKNGIFLSQDKYVGDILKKFGYSDVRYMIGSLMYLTASRPDIMFAVCACARHQVTPKEWHLHTVKRIFRYLKGHPKTGLCDYGGATQDRKSTTRGCQFLGRRLISWQCKKQTIVATSTTKAEYVVAASGCRQVLWIQNQMLDYGILTKRAIRIAQSKALLPDADEPASLSRDDRQGEAFLTVFSLDAGQDREDIAKT